MKITMQEFITQLNGAKALDAFRWRHIDMARVLVDQFSFDDTSATYLSPVVQEPDWGAWAKRRPGYFEPEGMVVQ